MTALFSGASDVEEIKKIYLCAFVYLFVCTCFVCPFSLLCCLAWGTFQDGNIWWYNWCRTEKEDNIDGVLMSYITVLSHIFHIFWLIWQYPVTRCKIYFNVVSNIGDFNVESCCLSVSYWKINNCFVMFGLCLWCIVVDIQMSKCFCKFVSQ